jgi:DNA-binding protein HU-beta
MLGLGEKQMTKAELVAAVSEKTGLSRAQAKDALEAVLDTVTESLKKGDSVRLVGFGAFRPVDRAAGPARNPRTGATVMRPASKTCRFQAGEALKGALN